MLCLQEKKDPSKQAASEESDVEDDEAFIDPTEVKEVCTATPLLKSVV